MKNDDLLSQVQEERYRAGVRAALGGVGSGPRWESASAPRKAIGCGHELASDQKDGAWYCLACEEVKSIKKKR